MCFALRFTVDCCPANIRNESPIFGAVLPAFSRSKQGHVLVKNYGHVKQHVVMVNAAPVNVERVTDHHRQAFRIRSLQARAACFMLQAGVSRTSSGLCIMCATYMLKMPAPPSATPHARDVHDVEDPCRNGQDAHVVTPPTPPCA